MSHIMNLSHQVKHQSLVGNLITPIPESMPVELVPVPVSTRMEIAPILVSMPVEIEVALYGQNAAEFRYMIDY